MNNEVLAIILGGGQGTRLFPLTQLRSKPAVPIGGKYRLIDIPISNCLHADIRRIFVLTQFNSASLNRHISQTYRMDLFSQGFVEILAAEQTPDNPNWFQGTADAVRQAARHFVRYDADYYLILAGDHLYRMDYTEMVDAHVDRRADITIAAQPVTPDDATQMGIFRFDRDGQIVAFEEKPNAERLAEIGQSIPRGAVVRRPHGGEAVRRLDGRVRVLARCAAGHAREQTDAKDFGREVIPSALDKYRVQLVPVSRLLGRRRHHRVVLRREHHADASPERRSSSTIRRGRSSRTRGSCPDRGWSTARVHDAIVAEGCYLGTLHRRGIGHRHPHARPAKAPRSGDRCCSAPTTTMPTMRRRRAAIVPRLGIGRNVVLDRVIVDKNARIGDGARLVNETGVEEADGDGYYIRNGVIIVPKDGVIKPGTVV